MAESKHGNFQSCCRLCLSEKLESLKPIFDEGTEDRSLPEKISQFVAVEINASDKLTTMVCDQCVMKVNHWHAYKQRCVRNQSKLLQWMTSAQNQLNGETKPPDMVLQVKEEPKDIEEVDTALVKDNSSAELPVNDDTPLLPENNVEVVMVKPEPMDSTEEPMEEEYNELPPPLTPYAADCDVDIEEGSPGDDDSNRRCSVCNKLFSSTGNRRKHEKKIHGMHGPPKIRSLANDLTVRKPLNGINCYGENGVQDDEIADQVDTPVDPMDPEQEKILYAAGLKLIQTNSTPISMESLSKIELSYIEKCKAMVSMHKNLECACHNVPHPNLKGLLSHLRALRIWFPVFTCYNCMITFTDRSTFTRHSVRCPRTSLETLTILSNLRKRSEVKTRLYQNFRCTYCKFMYSFHEDFIRHVDEDHSSLELPIACSCSRRFDNLEDYKDHVYVSCLVEFYCDICFITTKTLDGFQKHAAEVHDQSEGFILLQDDNYKIRKPQMHVSKEALDESAIVTGKRERKMSIKIPYEDEDFNTGKVINPVVLSPKLQNRICPVCEKEYSSYNNMMRHYKSHFSNDNNSSNASQASQGEENEDSFYSCPECGGMYNTVEWQQHLTEKHDPKTCEECGKMFQFQTELDNHRSVHLNLKVYKDSKTQSYKSTMLSPGSDKKALLSCEACDVLFSSREEFDQHMLAHDSEYGTAPIENVSETVEDKFSCKPCKKQYASYAGLWEHNRVKHPEKKSPFESAWPKKCDHCDKVCTTGAAMYRHKLIHEKDRIPDSSAPTKIPIIKKVESENEREEESYHTCKRCFKVFSSKYNLKNHMKCHGITNKKSLIKKSQTTLLKVKEEKGSGDEMDLPEGEEESPVIFTCDVCVMTFTTKAALVRHKEEHQQEDMKPVKKNMVYCKYCKIPFVSILLLTKHMHEEHDETAKPRVGRTATKPQFVCHICKKTFQTAAALTTHVGWHKRGTDYAPNMTNVPNSKQPKVLKQNKIIDKLANAQHNSKPDSPTESKFQCTTCLAELPNDTALQVHILEKHRSVSAIMLIPRCNTCNKDFATQDEYETHKRLHDFLERQKQHEKSISQQNSPSSQQVKSYAGQQKSYPCKYCNAGFSRSDTLGVHVRQFHKEFVQTEFRCPTCDRVFDKQNALTIHMKVHEKQQRTSMPAAAAAAATAAGTSRPMFSCSICNMGFDLPKDLRAHTISAHPF